MLHNLHLGEETQYSLFDDIQHSVMIIAAGPPSCPPSKIVYVNSAFTGLFGYASKDVVGGDPRLICGADTDRTELQHIRDRLLDRQPVQTELLCYREDGTALWVETNISPLSHTHDGKPCFIALQRDMTQRKSIDRARDHALAVSERRLNDFLMFVDEWFWETDADHRFTCVVGRESVDDEFGVKQTIGHTRWDIAGADPETDLVWRDFKALMDSHTSFTDFRFDRTDKHGRTRYIRASGAPRFENGRIAGYRGTSRDETDTFNAQRRAQAAESQLTEALESLTEGFILFDKDDRFVTCNNRYRQMFPKSVDRMVPGTTFEELFRSSVVRGEYALSDDADVEEVIRRRVAKHRAPCGPVAQKLANGTWVRVTETITASGGIAGMRADITELKQREEALAASEAQYRQLLEGSAQGALIHMDDRVVYANDAAARIFGYEAKEMIGRHRSAFVAPENLGDVESFIYSGEEGWIELRCLRRDGTVFWAQGNATNIVWDGRPARLNTVIDIDERKRAEARLRENEAHLSAILGTISEAVVTLDRTGLILSVNKAVEKTFGWSGKDLIGRSISVLIPNCPDTERGDVMSRTLCAAEDGMPDMEYRDVVGVRTDGSEFPLEFTVNEMTTENGQKLVAVMRDVSVRRQREEETHQLHVQLEQSRKMEAMGTLAGGIAHDINNALVPIYALTELTVDMVGADSDAADCLQQIGESAAHIGKLTERILAFSRQDQAQDRPLDIHVLLVETLDFLRSAIPSTVQLVTDVDPRTGEIMADETQFQQIVMNMLTNAVYALEGRPGHIEIKLDRVVIDPDQEKPPGIEPGTYAWLRINDDGPGIPSNILHRIFDPFFTTKPVGEGTGLGLSVAHGIVTAHGGTITASEGDGGGAQFDIYWPLQV